MKDYYAVLGVDREATPQEIRKRFMALARERHPDRFSGEEKRVAEAEFQSLTEAFNVLSSAERRRRHDLELARPQSQARQADPKQVAKSFLAQGTRAYRNRDFDRAIEEFERATKVDDRNAVAWNGLALASYHRGGAMSKAMSAIARACELDKMNLKYLKLAGRLFAEGGMPLRAERYYRQALEWSGDDPEIREALQRLKK
ncbi:MAG TPA: DnaJ domain-containing protein [Thermoanaerobaculia bacterium]|nr:DnaJ domain-containing protein [Thermoanaerobaculia bacterium]